jgi:hypothetical protein
MPFPGLVDNVSKRGGIIMTAEVLYETEFEKRQHLSAIHYLATDLGMPEDYLRQLYENELMSLKEQARIKDYLSVLVIKRMRERCHAHQAGNEF